MSITLKSFINIISRQLHRPHIICRSNSLVLHRSHERSANITRFWETTVCIPIWGSSLSIICHNTKLPFARNVYIALKIDKFENKQAFDHNCFMVIRTPRCWVMIKHLFQFRSIFSLKQECRPQSPKSVLYSLTFRDSVGTLGNCFEI